MGKCASCLPFTDSASPETNTPHIRNADETHHNEHPITESETSKMTCEEKTSLCAHATSEETKAEDRDIQEDEQVDDTIAKKMADLSLDSKDPWEYSSHLTIEQCRDLLKDHTLANTAVFTPPIRFGKCVKVYDGDTIHVVCPVFPSVISRFKIRINGIDCPELRTKDDWEKKAGNIAKKLLSELILDQIVELKDTSMDKYGRQLSIVIFEGIDVAQWLTEQGWAVPYSGSGVKQVKSTDWKSRVEAYEFTAEP